ncbi:2-hydroxyacyl-CoA dehydratase subunit D [Thermodesulfobacteriota bacterium]
MSKVKGIGKKTESADWQAQKSKKQLKSSAAVRAFQKEWVRRTRERIDAGEPFGMCNAGEAEEIFLIMDIPVLVKQWWSGLIAAKQLSPYYFDLLDEKGYDICRYCSLGLGCTMDRNPERSPWGGLPKPTVIIGGVLAGTDCDAGQRINELWAREDDAYLYPLDVTARTGRYHRWWESIKDNWNEIIEPHRLDLRVEELKALIRFLEITTGKTFSMARFREVMDLVNEQSGYFRKARDLIADTVPAPVSLPDQVSVYPAQWHRGTKAGLDLAKMFYKEVKERVENGEAACPNEKLRLMWLGVGLWHNTAFYQYFEEKYGAVFTCSVYLAAAAEGYPRNVLDDPLRALASRHLFIGIGDSEWYVKEAKLNRVNGVVQLVSKNCRESVVTPLQRMAFENAGIPVLPIYADNVDARAWDDEQIKSQVSDFIETRIFSC